MNASADGVLTAQTLHEEQVGYYGRPVVKPHVWSWMIPLYFWIGGTAGAAAVAAGIERARGNERLAEVHRATAFAGAMISPVLLIADLGVPARFFNMLRVFKPTSPMSVGSWTLAAFGTALGTSVGASLLGLRPVARAAEGAAALLGPVMTTYTAALISNTATPSWSEASPEMPLIFVASGISGAGAVAAVAGTPESNASARRMLVGGALAIVWGTANLERRLGPLLAEPYRTGRAGGLLKASRACAIAGAAVGLVVGRRRPGAIAAGVLVAAAGILERFGIVEAGTASARDPKYTVIPQRERLAAHAAASA